MSSTFSGQYADTSVRDHLSPALSLPAGLEDEARLAVYKAGIRLLEDHMPC